ncbi:MAG TPA: helix-turn-helix domain-containing protein, partial [Pseudomonadales bacterium]|nr:helix-turn-helix domain-containing protein [Pseudomonadales bacterium]
MQPIRTEHWLGVSETDDELTQQILDATFELICQFGIRRTSFDDIARKAKVGRATVFRRMKDKPQLLQMLVQRERGRFIRAIRQHSEKLEDPKDRFVQGVMMAIRLACANPMLRGLLSAEP